MNMLFNKKTIVLVMVLVTISLFFTGCSNKEESQKTTASQTTVEKKESDKANEPKKEEQTVKKNEDSNKKVAQNSANSPKMIKQFLGKNIEVKFATPWKGSSSKALSACIDGKGPEAQEEGNGKILIKSKDGNVNSFEVSDKKLAPKYLEWENDQNLLVILSRAQGTLAKGGSLYIMNASTGKITPVIEITDKKQQIVKVEKSGNSIKLKVNVFNDDNFDKSHAENWVINSFDSNMKNKMEVKNSQGKIMYTIN